VVMWWTKKTTASDFWSAMSNVGFPLLGDWYSYDWYIYSYDFDWYSSWLFVFPKGWWLVMFFRYQSLSLSSMLNICKHMQK
jgi:hypothetical protein